MADKPNELRGTAKEAAGKLTGDEELEAKGKAEKETAKAKRKGEGKAEELKGTVKEQAGKLTGKEETEAKGKFEKEKGKAKQI